MTRRVEMSGAIGSYFSLTKPRVVVLLQITALCATLSHDFLSEAGLGMATIETMAIVLVGGYLTAGGANAINMWYDRDIDPMMRRTADRPIPLGEISPNSALFFGVLLSILGTLWLIVLANEVAAFWAAFSVLFYVFIYSIWLKRSTPQNIVIGGIAGSTPPLVGWASAESDLQLSTESASLFIDSVTDIGGLMPWFMFVLIFLWTPPHFWALALYRSKEYGEVGIPMMPNVKGPERTLLEMKIYAILLIALSAVAPIAYGGLNQGDMLYHVLGWNAILLSSWYATTVWRIDLGELPDEDGRMATASRSFIDSMVYLALVFVMIVTSSIGLSGAIIGAILTMSWVIRIELTKRSSASQS
ncbi:MAG: protoheme IX farnesyltransferase [Euryarchaeota archaeon]|nr:protoheme IX farnesyltransferase [Euryarchaeota archaeon]|tara:strand:+ start:68 stop:1144 length:1077 start_codon:yes stop_codon:yes gene_type:complete